MTPRTTACTTWSRSSTASTGRTQPCGLRTRRPRAAVVNFSGQAKEWVRVGVPRPGRWRVILDTSGFDAAGTPSQADNVMIAEGGGWNNQPWFVTVRVAELSAVYLAPDIEPEPVVVLDEPAAADAGDATTS